MDRIDQMRIFVRVAETRSFSGVARELSLSQSTVSKQVAGLEDRLGARLLSRSTRRVTLTEEGAAYYDDCRAILDAVAEAEAGVARTRTAPAGLLRMACAVSFGTRAIAPLLPSFMAENPDLRIELMLSDRFVDLVEEGVDLAIRIGDLADSTLVSRRVATSWRELVATPAYLNRTGRPKALRDLRDHNCLLNTGFTEVDRWTFLSGKGEVSAKVGGTLSADNSEALREAVIRDLGIGLLPVWLVEGDLAEGRLERVLPDLEPRPLPIQALYPRGRFVPAKVRRTIEMLTRGLNSRESDR